MKRIPKFLLLALMLMGVWSMAAVPAAALADGAYTVGRNTSYVNPETGRTEDGGTNIALGESMCQSLVEERLLVEQVGGKTYLTIGLGMMSNVERVRIQVKEGTGGYREVPITQTGTCQRSGDTCHHYRFQVSSPQCTIRPILYVTPMGRDVQFFVIPDLSAPQPGAGNFVSQMIPRATPAPTPAPTPVPATPAPKTAPATPEPSAPPKAPATPEPEQTAPAAMPVPGPSASPLPSQAGAASPDPRPTPESQRTPAGGGYLGLGAVVLAVAVAVAGGVWWKRRT